MVRALPVLLVAAACGQRAPEAAAPVPEAPVVAAVAADATDAPPDATPPPDAEPEGPLVTIDAWGVLVAVPPGAAHAYDELRDTYRIELDADRIVSLHVVPRAAPATLDDAIRPYADDREMVSHGNGVTVHGAMFSIRSFEVRVGMRDERGGILHYFIDISRVNAWLPLDDAHHLECTGYYEDGVESASHPAIAALAEICLSIRLTP